MSWEQDLQTWARGRQAPEPTLGEARQLVARLEARRAPRRWIPLVPVMAAAAAAFGLVVLPGLQPDVAGSRGVWTPIPPSWYGQPEAVAVWLEPGGQAEATKSSYWP